MIISIATSGAYALTQGQKSIGNIGADITWYDFGDFTNYFIQEDDETGFYFLSMSNESSGICKTVVLNAKGEDVLKPIAYTGFDSFVGGAESVYVIQTEDNHYYYIDSNGIKTIDGNAYREIGNFYNGYATVTLKSDSQKGVIDINGNLIFENKEGNYKEFRYLGSGVFSAEISENCYDFLNDSGTLLTESHYNNDWLLDVSEETISVTKDGKYGFLDLSGKEIVPFIYDDANSFHEGLASVCRNGKWGCIDKSGKDVILPDFDTAISFHNGLAMVSSNGKWGLIDKEGTIILPIVNDYVMENENGGYTASNDNKAFLLDSSGKLVVTGDYSYMCPDANGKMYAEKIINGSTVGAYFDENQSMLTGFKEFSLRYLSDKLYLGTKRGEYPEGIVPPHDYSKKFALLDSGGNNLTGFKYSNAGIFFNNCQVVNRYYYGTAGLVNQYGAEVLPTIFDNILLTDEGYAFIMISYETGGNSRVGYFKIPESYSSIKPTKPITVYLNGSEL